MFIDSFWFANYVSIWALLLLNLTLTLRLVRWHRSIEELQKRNLESETRPELEVGAVAPNFTLKTLTGAHFNTLNLTNSTLVIFFSPECPHCRQEVPPLTKLSKLAKTNSNVDFILASAGGTAETINWIKQVSAEDGIDIDIPTLTALPSVSDFFFTYNPRGILPYFCLLSSEGVIIARNRLGMGEWPKLKRGWEGSAHIRSTQGHPRLYRRHDP